MALNLSKKINYKKGIAQALTLIGTHYYYKGENDKAVRYYRDALESIENEKSNDYPFKTFIRLSILYRQQAYFDSSSYYLEKAGIEIKEQPVGALHASLFGSTGLLLNAVSKNDEALKYFEKALAIRIKINDSVRIADTWRNMGAVY